jgi:hypothetical protein
VQRRDARHGSAAEFIHGDSKLFIRLEKEQSSSGVISISKTAKRGGLREIENDDESRGPRRLGRVGLRSDFFSTN